MITAPEGMALQISGGGRTQGGIYDYLIFYEGNTNKKLEAGEYYGDPFTVPALRTAGNVLKIYFHSNSAAAYAGFALTVTLISEDTPVYDSVTSLSGSAGSGYFIDLSKDSADYLDLTGKTEGFTFKVYDDGGPDVYYSNFSDAYLKIIAPEGAKIRVSGSGFTAEDCDFLKFFDGNKYGSVLGENDGYSGEIEIEELTSSGNTLTVFFSSDDENNEEGFCLYVSIVFDTALSGDVDGDGEIDINDVTALLNVLAGGGAAGDCDVNADGIIDIDDVTALLNILAGY